MSKITVSVLLPATPQEVWEYVRNLQSHTEWMLDAEKITYRSDQHEGVGTTIECLTKVGPLKLTDVMSVTRWEDTKAIGVDHVGIVTGTGQFTLEAFGSDNRTLFTWSEDLTFPVYMGGAVGGVVGAQVMKLIWKRNLKALKQHFG